MFLAQFSGAKVLGEVILSPVTGGKNVAASSQVLFGLRDNGLQLINVLSCDMCHVMGVVCHGAEKMTRCGAVLRTLALPAA